MASDPPNSPQSSPTNWPPEQQARLDYAWNWFNFHAEQRTKMFNYMLLGLGILATAIATTLQRGPALAAIVLSFAAVLICIAFGRMDRRNRDLYELGQRVLSRIEEHYLFAGMETGIAKEVAREDTELKRLKWPTRQWWRGGYHRIWMPIVTWTFGLVFLAALAFACYMYGHSDSYPSTDKTIVVCCGTADSSGSSGTGFDLYPKNGPILPNSANDQLLVPAEGTGSITGWHWLQIAGGLLLIAVGAAAFNRSKLLGSGLIAIGTATAALPNFSFPIHAQFHLDPHFEAKIEADLRADVDHLLNLFRESQPGLMGSVRFGDFGEGIEAFDCKLPLNAELVSKTNAAIELAQARALQPIVLLVGGTDRKPLSPALRARFETNTGLARARVSAIERCLGQGDGGKRSSTALPPEVIRLVTGPSYTPTSRDPESVANANLAEDREVRVLVIGLEAKKP